MRRMLLLVALVAPLSAAAEACGGSASETPWPVEPVDTAPGPEGEERSRGNVVDVDKLPGARRTGQPDAGPDAD